MKQTALLALIIFATATPAIALSLSKTVGRPGTVDPSGPQPTEASILAAWEKIQRDDPKTIIFEQVEPGLYRFKTERFPFDGHLRNVTVTIDDGTLYYEGQFIQGVVEMQLHNLDGNAVETSHPHSYSQWAESNRLFFDVRTGHWVTSDKMYELMDQRRPWWEDHRVATATSIAIFVVAIIVIIKLLTWSQNKQFKKALAAEQANTEALTRLAEQFQTTAKHDAERNHLLKEILDQLRSDRGG